MSCGQQCDVDLIFFTYIPRPPKFVDFLKIAPDIHNIKGSAMGSLVIGGFAMGTVVEIDCSEVDNLRM
jgi:hypothetical protein